jgi:hypothetical protein
MEAGAQGGYYLQGKQTGPEGPWEPLYDDPVYLEKLERFLKVFARRYDGKPWLRYIDVGSLGDWGEGHTSSGSRLQYGYEQRKVHVDLYLKYFQNTQIVVSDDFVYGIRNLKDRSRMHQYILAQGITYRDDSILVGGYLKGYSDTYTVRSPEFFEDVWQIRPTILELQHYGSIKRNGNWLGGSNSLLEKYAKGKTGADFFRGAISLLHATYIGYHGYAHEWLSENPDLTAELLNRCGYWYYLHWIKLKDVWKAGTSQTITALWENRGVAPAYQSYQLILRLQGAETVELELDSGNQKWIPLSEGKTYRKDYVLDIPKMLSPGRYELKLKLYSTADDREVFLALDPSLLDDSNFYPVATVTVAE